jgi:hypothetical protein
MQRTLDASTDHVVMAEVSFCGQINPRLRNCNLMLYSTKVSKLLVVDFTGKSEEFAVINTRYNTSVIVLY